MILYSRLNNYRKADFRLITTIEEENGKKFVRKKSISNKSKKFLKSYIEKYNLLEEASLDFEIVKPKYSEDSVVYDFIEGNTLLWEIEAHARKSDFRKVIELIKTYNLVDLLPKGKEQVSDDFKVIFGDSLQKETEWVSPGLLDMNYDNFIKREDKLFLFDYEWTWDFALPKDFIRFRAVSNLLFNLLGKGIDISLVYEEFKYLFKKEYIRAEFSFQKYVTGSNSTYEQYVEDYFNKMNNPVEHKFYIQRLEEDVKKLSQELGYYKMRYEAVEARLRIFRKIFQNRYTLPIYNFFKSILRKIFVK